MVTESCMEDGDMRVAYVGDNVVDTCWRGVEMGGLLHKLGQVYLG